MVIDEPSVKPLEFFDAPPLRYFGSKWQLADWVVAQMPPHKTYVEPYCGGASIFFRKPPSKIEVLNDLNGDVVNFFEVLRTQTDELVFAIDMTPFSLVEYELSFEPCEDKLERARRFYVRSYQSFGCGGIAGKTGWRRQLNSEARGSSVTHDWARLGGLLKGARRLKAALIDSSDALLTIERFDTPDTLFYVDPPYVFSSRARSSNRYTNEMSNDEHRRLAEALHKAQGMVLLSGYRSELYEDLYGDWSFLTKTNTTNGNGKALEYLWLSPNATNLNTLPLFAGR